MHGTHHYNMHYSNEHMIDWLISIIRKTALPHTTKFIPRITSKFIPPITFIVRPPLLASSFQWIVIGGPMEAIACGIVASVSHAVARRVTSAKHVIAVCACSITIKLHLCDSVVGG
jgi:hypothetical protein